MSNDDASPVSDGLLSVDDIAVLQVLVAGTASGTGEVFLQSLVRHLATALNVQYAFIAEFADVRSRVRTRAYWARDQIVENVEFDLAGTPCEDVINGRLCHHPQCVADLFPNDLPLCEMCIESYLGVPLVSDAGSVLGHLAVFDVRPMPPEPKRLQVFRIFAARAAAELDRLRMERELAQSEQRYRDLFEQAPIPYVYEDTDTRFINANAAFMKLLGLKPEDVPGTFGLSLVSPDPAGRARLDHAFADIKAGRQRELIELELRRKDNGQPVWVQFWSRPDLDGKNTRTMIIDITDRVLAEREGARLQQQNLYLQEEIKQVHNFEEIIGRSGPLKCVLENVERVAQTDATVLITGETGTGKELIARAIHSLSNRKDKPLIKINCAALPSGLVESELFGHEKGAFTGAITRRIGRFELAAGGTIFLDEIGEISP
jgi:formate hydrogenlyase transcriptional activator